MTRPEMTRMALRHREGDPVFAEQWHAQAIAVVDLLIAKGDLDPELWARTLGSELDRHASQGAEDSEATYYGAFLDALQQILDRTHVAERTEVDRREKDWRDAYLATPHGKPVVLRD